MKTELHPAESFGDCTDAQQDALRSRDLRLRRPEREADIIILPNGTVRVRFWRPRGIRRNVKQITRVAQIARNGRITWQNVADGASLVE